LGAATRVKAWGKDVPHNGFSLRRGGATKGVGMGSGREKSGKRVLWSTFGGAVKRREKELKKKIELKK